MEFSLGMKMKGKYPTRIPIILHEGKGILLIKKKFLVPEEMTLGNLMIILRKYINLKDTEAMFAIINNELPPISDSLSSLYNKHKNKEDVLDIHIRKESTFGFR
jgi:hypothetical protein